jgi:serine/threonine protein kinase
MGVVYRAFDTRLNRSVAIKVLLAATMADGERRKRFVQEARAASALNHPNIITVHEVDEADGITFIVMELVAGRTLDRLIGRKGLKVGDALKYAAQIADALATAHGAGIVHRDLKPANVMVSDAGRVKVLDFGVAKLTERVTADDSAPTRTSPEHVAPRTEEGRIVGTIPYMSPEQAEGKNVDSRSDIFSFGSLLHEMVTGQRAFSGETGASTLSAILHREPRPASELVERVPRDLDRLIAHCLRKDPARRFQHLDDVKTLLDELNEEAHSGRLAAQEPPRSASPRWSRRATVAVIVVVLLAAMTVVVVLRPKMLVIPRAEPSLTLLTSDSGLTTDPALSRDGTLLAFASDRAGGDNLDIWVKQVGGSEPLQLTTHEADDHEPSLAPDGRRIAFRSERDDGGVYLVSTLGGDERLIASGGRRPRFSPDGQWLAFWVGGIGAEFAISGGSRVYVVNSGGGAARPVASNIVAMRYPVWAPDSTRLLVYGASEYKGPGAGNYDWWVVSLDGGPAIKTGAFDTLRRQKHAVGMETQPSAWTSDNFILFCSRFGDSTNVWQVPISPETFQISDTAQRLTAGTGLEAFPAMSGRGDDGARRLAFASLSQNTDVWSLPFAGDRGANQGKVGGGVQRLTQDAAPDVHPALSLDGKLLLFASGRLGNQDIWAKDLQGGKERLFAGTTLPEWHPAIAGDGATVAYQVIEGVSPQRREIDSIYVVIRGGQPKKLCDDCFLPTDLSSDGTKLLYWSMDQRRIGLIDVQSGARTDLLHHPVYAILRGMFSPDDRWIAFLAIGDADKRLNFIVPFAGPRSPTEREWIPVTSGETHDQVAGWSPDGNLIYLTSYRDGFECLWAQHLNLVTKQPVGAAFPVHHLHSTRRSLGNVPVIFQEFGVSSDKFVLPLVERTGNIWMIER